MLKNKSAASYIGLVLAVLAAVLALFGNASQGLVRDSFSGLILLFLALGAVAGLIGFFAAGWEITDLASVLFFGLALGFIFKDGIEVLVYDSIGIDNNVGGNGALVTAYLILGGILVVLSVAKCFMAKQQ